MHVEHSFLPVLFFSIWVNFLIFAVKSNQRIYRVPDISWLYGSLGHERYKRISVFIETITVILGWRCTTRWGRWAWRARAAWRRWRRHWTARNASTTTWSSRCRCCRSLSRRGNRGCNRWLLVKSWLAMIGWSILITEMHFLLYELIPLVIMMRHLLRMSTHRIKFFFIFCWYRWSIVRRVTIVLIIHSAACTTVRRLAIIIYSSMRKVL